MKLSLYVKAMKSFRYTPGYTIYQKEDIFFKHKFKCINFKNICFITTLFLKIYYFSKYKIYIIKFL